MKKLLTLFLALAMICSAFAFGGAAASDPFEMKEDAVAFYHEASGYYKWVSAGQTAGELAAQFTGSVTILDAKGNAVADDENVGSDYTVNADGENRKILVYGDVNRDAKVNVKDAIAMIQQSVGLISDICMAAYDVNLDSKTNVKDTMRIVQMISGWDVEIGELPWGLDLEKVDAPNEDGTLEIYFTEGTAKTNRQDAGLTMEVYSYSMKLAKNEAEHCHANVTSFIGHEGLNVTLSDFTDKLGNTLETTFLWEDDITVRINDTKVPDRLPPIEKDFKINANEGQALFIKAKANEESPAGLYRACLEITDAEGLIIKRAYVYAEVWDFAIPVSSSVKTAFGLGAYGIYAGHSVTVDPDNELYAAYYEYLLENRINPWCMPYAPTEEGADKYMSDPRVNTFLVGGGYAGSKYGGGMNGGLTAEYVSEAYAKLSQNEEWAKKAIFYLDDEPLRADALNSVVSSKAFLDQYYPNARIIVPIHVMWFDTVTNHGMPNHEAGLATDESNSNPQFDNLDTLEIVANNSQILCPSARLFPTPDIRIDGVLNWYTQRSTDTFGTLTDRLAQWREKGKEIWWYTANSPRQPLCNLSITHSGMQNRVLFWEQYFYDIDGMLYWATNEWPSSGKKPSVEGEEGLLVYCGNAYDVYGPLACLRAEIARDGIEDFEYLTMIEELFGREKANEFVTRMTTDITEYETDYELLAEIREEMGELLESALSAK